MIWGKKRICLKKTSVSDTFVGEVLMGTLGCYISCDEYTKESLKDYAIPQSFNKKQIAGLVKLIKSNVETFTHYTALKKSLNTGCDYSVMKLLDSALWQEGCMKNKSFYANKKEPRVRTRFPLAEARGFEPLSP